MIDYDILLKTKDEENHKKIELQNINPSDETILEILNGFLNTDKGILQMARTFNANKLQILTKIVIPANIPTFINSLKDIIVFPFKIFDNREPNQNNL